MPAYTSAAELRSRANVPTAFTDASLELILNAAESVAKRYLGYDPVSASVQLVLAGDGSERLSLGHPTTAVASVYERWDANGVVANFTSDHLLTVGEDYLLDGTGGGIDRPGVLIRIGTVWPYRQRRDLGRLASEYAPHPGSVLVNCTQGVAGADLMAVADAVYMEAAARWAARFGTGAITSEGLDGYNYSRQPPTGVDASGSPFASPYAMQTLRAMRRIPISR